MFLTVISPIYKGEGMMRLLVDRIIRSVESEVASFEIILVNDASPDKAWEEIEQICKEEKRVKAINLSRNFGQQQATTAGLNAASGEWIVVMDCDLQDRPEEIPRLINKALEGYDVVLAQRAKRKDKLIKRITSSIFSNMFYYLTEIKQDPSVANFGIYHRKVIEAVLSMGDSIKLLSTMVKWVGFKQVHLAVEHGKREVGTTSYNFSKLLVLAIDFIITFSDKPLRLVMRLGLIISSIAFLIGVYYIIKYFSNEIELAGYTSLILSLWFLSGVIIALIGMVGIYIGKIFAQVKNRPVFIERNRINF